MKIIIYTLGKPKNTQMSELIENYLKKIQHFCSLEWHSLRDSRHSDPVKRIEEEALLITSKIDKTAPVLVLDEKGATYTSMELSTMIDKWEGGAIKKVQWVIGGSHGLPETFKKKYPGFSLSTLTLTHEMALLFLAEQLYRAYTLSRNIPYHH